ncbi:MAG: hypothetical protein IPH57_07440 [Saprospiraceae bacterium]|nr:hypothetical protein [Saprospiraceae bacterium]
MKKMNFTKLPGSILSKLTVLILVLFIGTSVFGQYTMTTCQEPYVQAYGQTGTTYVGAGDDSDYAITLPFTFNYFGNVTTAGVGTNGYVTLGGTQYHSYGICPLPSTYTLGTLFPFQQDLYQGTSVDPNSGIYTRTDGTAPNRIFTIEYYRTGHYSGTSGQYATLQVRLYETSNIIRFKYQDVVLGELRIFMITELMPL